MPIVKSTVPGGGGCFVVTPFFYPVSVIVLAELVTILDAEYILAITPTNFSCQFFLVLFLF